MKDENSRNASIPESGKTAVQRGKTGSLSSVRKRASEQDNDDSERTGIPAQNAKPEPPPVRVIIEGGRPDGFTG